MPGVVDGRALYSKYRAYLYGCFAAVFVAGGVLSFVSASRSDGFNTGPLIGLGVTFLLIAAIFVRIARLRVVLRDTAYRWSIRCARTVSRGPTSTARHLRARRVEDARLDQRLRGVVHDIAAGLVGDGDPQAGAARCDERGAAREDPPLGRGMGGVARLELPSGGLR
jgi:hypothetical protein